MTGLVLHPKGHLHLADDGVVRSYNDEGVVVDYVRLSNAQISEYLDGIKLSYSSSDMRHFQEIFDNVDGLNVTDREQLANPPSWLRPLALSARTRNPIFDVVGSLQERQSRCVRLSCSSNEDCHFHFCFACLLFDRATFMRCRGP